MVLPPLVFPAKAIIFDRNMLKTQATETVLATLNFLCKLRMDPISCSVCSWQTFTASHMFVNETRSLP
jgi:hypothetical protein